MTLPARYLCVITAIVLMLQIHPADSIACTPPYCWGGFFLPGSGQVPANVDVIKWWPYYKSWLAPVVDESNVAIFQVSGAEELPVSFTLESNDDRTYLLRIEQDLAPGSEYVLRCDDQCREEDPIETRFTASNPAALPSEIGVLVVSEPRIEVITVATSSGSCDTEVTAAIVDIELQHADGATPWTDVFSYKTFVDGEWWAASASLAGSPDWRPGGSWMGRGVDRVYVLCASDDSGAQLGVEEGAHSVEMEATLPGRDEVLRSNSVSFSLSCSTAAPDAQEGEDVLAPDAEDADDAMPDAGGDDPADVNPPDGNGCACAVAR